MYSLRTFNLCKPYYSQINFQLNGVSFALMEFEPPLTIKLTLS